MKKDSTLYVVLFTFAVCILFVLPLALANSLTEGRVRENRLYAAHVAVLKAFGLADATTPRAEVERIYASSVRELAGEEGAWAATIDGAESIAVRQVGPGLWGSITAIVAADAAATRLRGLEILEQAETPGLGGRIDEPWFKEQFRGKKVGPGGRILVDQNGTGKGETEKESQRVDGISGASRTSDFVGRIVDAAIARIARVGGAK